MRKFVNHKIFISDAIHSNGIKMLKNSGFDVVECYNLNNPQLFNLIKKSTEKAKNNICLIIRSVRRIMKRDVDVLSSIHVNLLCTASSGFDNIDVAYCRKKCIKVLNVPYGNYIPAAEHTVALILNILKSVSVADFEMKSGIYESLKYKNFELNGKTIGIIGVGKVGSHVARLSKSFGAKIVGNDIKKSLKYKYKWIIFKELNDLLKEADIVTVHTPLDESTLNLLSKNRLRLLKTNAVLINCARGGIVNEVELIRLLKNNKIYYAGIDVFKNEPDINKNFRKLKNVILTPHLAGKTVESKERISVQLAERIIEYYSEK